MRNKLLGLCLASIFTTFSINAQSRKLDKANKSFENFDYYGAVSQYEALVEDGNTSPEIYQNLGDANYLNANYSEASKWYKMLSDSGTESMDTEHMHRYAQSLRSIKEYEESDRIMEKLGATNKNDLRAAAYGRSKDYLRKIKEQSGRYMIENIDINSTASDFAPSFRMDALIFSTARDTGTVSKSLHNWNKKRFLNLYTSTITDEGFANTIQFSDKLNTKLHESSTAFTADGETVYFTRNNEKRGGFSRDEEGISRLKIYRAHLINGKWKKIKELPFNSDDYSVAHPTLNKAENKLYFSSDMPGTLGQSDIFVVDINEDGSFGTPKNLGNKINTESKETFPFITADDILYFASDGHPGLGGMDIFATDLKRIETSQIVNLGEPVNSTYDDFSLVLNSETKKGYFASNRADGVGDDDIYALTELKATDFECYSNLSGIVKDKKTGAIVVNAIVLLLDQDNQEVAETVSGSDGKFILKSDCSNQEYQVVASKVDYERDLVNINNNGELDVPLIELLLAKEDGGAYIRSDSKKILDKIIAYMNAYPEAKIQVRSHTDSRASDSYNTSLSERRAKETVAYLVKQGISSSKISGKGFGESQLTNECDDNTKCQEEKHQQNRRSEFIVVE